jgi:hypothetical protein
VRSALLLVVAACGDAPPADVDATAWTTAGEAVAFGPTTGTTVTVPITPTQDGSLLVVVVTESGVAGWAVNVMTTEPPAHILPNELTVVGDCPRAGMLWSTDFGAGGVDAVRIEMTAAVTLEAYVIEASGLRSVASTGRESHPVSAPTASAPMMDADSGQLVVSMVDTCATLDAVVPTSPFTGLVSENGQGVAYTITTSLGTYGAEWSYGGGAWDAATVTFH